MRAIEQLEQAIGVPRHPALESIPSRARYDAVERRHMEIVFDVHGHGVHDTVGTRRHVDHRAPFRVMTVLIVSSTMTKSSAIDRFLM